MEKELQQKLVYSEIPYAEVKKMVTTFHAHEKKHPQYDASQHVKAVWFSIEDIQTICKRLEAEGADGLRVYFGRYPADVSEFQNPKPHPNTNSVIFVSTRVKDGIPHSDYFDNLNPMTPKNRGEQCQPHCGGINADLLLA